MVFKMISCIRNVLLCIVSLNVFCIFLYSLYTVYHQRVIREKFSDWKAVMCDDPKKNITSSGMQLKSSRKKYELSQFIQQQSKLKHAVQPGGKWSPSGCVARQRVAIIIPFRGRQQHLTLLLNDLIPLLKNQQLGFQIFVVEQFGSAVFNKGRLMNAGFFEAFGRSLFDCYIFHDVDLVPETDMSVYTCEEWPKHISVAVDTFNYRLPYPNLVGGVLAFRPEHFVSVNGYSNEYWGWGGEDDDMAARMIQMKLGVCRQSAESSRYRMIPHDPSEMPFPALRYILLGNAERRMFNDGLCNLVYKLTSESRQPLYTHIVVDIGSEPLTLTQQ
ncbi:beta-1,4-N-acetylgalactosaminyltransferase bre-4-like isoform X2 [Dreissena polymorpha]|uniref:beta-1,4-N-acetylgalactosaminyltransferase bre-4-like isoform X2 n=1 Tax=Dreissena polymorpha TaxID=45954 RepID=UPI002263F87B|nr:beta-1,4-N-acetylgalactosaminyltransferase bre-4-like isoform X2 [Dreissena polymorpha]